MTSKDAAPGSMTLSHTEMGKMPSSYDLGMSTVACIKKPLRNIIPTQGNGSYISPYIIDNSPDSEPRFELKNPKDAVSLDLIVGAKGKRVGRSTNKRRVYDSDEDYQPSPERFLKSDVGKPYLRQKKETETYTMQSQNPIQPKQRSPSVSSLAKRRRGRPRKHARLEDGAAQAFETQISLNNYNYDKVSTRQVAIPGTSSSEVTAQQAKESLIPTVQTLDIAEEGYRSFLGAITPTIAHQTQTTMAQNTGSMPVTNSAANIQAPGDIRPEPTRVGSSAWNAANRQSITHVNSAHVNSAHGNAQEILTHQRPRNATMLAGSYNQPHLTHYNSYQDFWKNHENGQQFCREAAVRGAMAERTVQGTTASNTITPVLANVNISSQLPAQVRSTQNPLSRQTCAQRAAYITRLTAVHEASEKDGEHLPGLADGEATSKSM
nr:uncharacterized protein CTRU02_06818 [Colletotrichum truncatum]KAF6792201.1 hypothetical protein CTRU02_06818 [Colletotrichum truncatum]